MLERLAVARSAFVLGRGATLAVAVEAALKLKETCAIHAEAYSAAEVLHGPAELVERDFPIIAFVLLTGGWFGLPHVETPLWGGLMVTLTISFVGLAASLPLGILLALGRRSKMPIVKMLCVIFIETVRGVPLVAVLFMASVMLPLFVPDAWSPDKLAIRTPASHSSAIVSGPC